MRNHKRGGLLAAGLVFIAAIVAGRLGLLTLPDAAHAGSGLAQRETVAGAEAAGEVLEAFRAGRSGIVVEVGGQVTRLLPDDEDGTRHQRFLLRLANEHSLLVAHNIDLAPRVPLSVGDRVELRGQYEWNEQGGVVHWTHHDPGDRRPGGWIRLGERTYR